MTVKERHHRIFDYVASNPDLFPGFFHYDLEGNVLPKLAVRQEFGFYAPDVERRPVETTL